MTIAALPTLNRASATFRADVDAYFVTALPNFSTQAEAARLEILANQAAAAGSASSAAISSTTASTALAIVAAQANFKGTWVSQLGAISKPASVLHNGAYWMLLNNLADVTTSQPGVTADWSVVGGSLPTVTISTNTTAAPWTKYLIVGACTLTLPTPAAGAPVGIRVQPGVSGAVVSGKVNGTTSDYPVDAPLSADLTYSGASLGWV